MSNGGFAYTMYPLVNFHSSLLKLATEIVDNCPFKMVIFRVFLYVYQRVIASLSERFKAPWTSRDM